MRPHVKSLRKRFQTLTRMGKLKAAHNCAVCGVTAEESGRKLELHHIVSLSSLEAGDSFDPNVQENLITMCHGCHQTYHKCFEEAYPDQLILDWIRKVPYQSMLDAYASFKKIREAKRREARAKHQQTNK